MRRTLLVPLALAVTLVAAALVLTTRLDPDRQTVTTLYGNVDLREATLSFRVAGRVQQLHVDEGAAIHQGDLLAELDPAPLLTALHGAEGAVAAAAARLQRLQQGYRQEDRAQASANVSAARAALLEAKRQLSRLQNLTPRGATTQSDLDAARSHHDQAKAQLALTEANLAKLQAGYQSEEIAEARASLQQANASLAAAQLAVADTRLTAPSDGVLLTRSVEVGENVQAGTPAFTLSLTRPVWIRAYVPEPELGLFPSGARVQVWSDSRPDHPYTGTVGFVSPSAEFTPKSVETTDLRTALVYRLRIRIDDADDLLRQGMPVTLRLMP